MFSEQNEQPETRFMMKIVEQLTTTQNADNQHIQNKFTILH
jgi:hypothetical protein